MIAVSPEVADIKVGDRVACSGSQCAWHAEKVAVPRNLIAPVPDNVRLDQAAFVTLGAISMEALRRTHTHFGEVVVVYGLGLLGLLATQMARYAGIRTIGIDTNPERLEPALRMGASVAIDPAKDDPTKVVHDFTRGFGADGVILGVVTESSEPLNLSFELCRYKGTVVGLGLFGMDITRSRMFENDVTFVGSRAYGPGRYDPVYEEGNVDMPIGWVRWTENRNATEFLRELSIGAVDRRRAGAREGADRRRAERVRDADEARPTADRRARLRDRRELSPRPLEFDDTFRIVWPSQPAISPDGRRVAFVVDAARRSVRLDRARRSSVSTRRAGAPGRSPTEPDRRSGCTTAGCSSSRAASCTIVDVETGGDATAGRSARGRATRRRRTPDGRSIVFVAPDPAPPLEAGPYSVPVRATRSTESASSRTAAGPHLADRPGWRDGRSS